MSRRDRKLAPSLSGYLWMPPLGIEPRTFGLKVRCSAS
jgi:hypothetical protein